MSNKTKRSVNLKVYDRENAVQTLIQICRKPPSDKDDCNRWALFLESIRQLNDDMVFTVIATLRKCDEMFGNYVPHGMYDNRMIKEYKEYTKMYPTFQTYYKRYKKLDKNKKTKLDIESDDGMCLICHEKQRATLCEPCGHIVVCEDCSQKLAEDETHKKKCILCRQNITRISYVESGKEIWIE